MGTQRKDRGSGGPETSGGVAGNRGGRSGRWRCRSGARSPTARDPSASLTRPAPSRPERAWPCAYPGRSSAGPTQTSSCGWSTVRSRTPLPRPGLALGLVALQAVDGLGQLVQDVDDEDVQHPGSAAQGASSRSWATCSARVMPIEVQPRASNYPINRYNSGRPDPLGLVGRLTSPRQTLSPSTPAGVMRGRPPRSSGRRRFPHADRARVRGRSALPG